MIPTFTEGSDTHPAELVTVKLCVPEVRPGIVALAPVPEMAPGLMIQFPAGSPLKTTLPVAIAQVGCVMVPMVGAGGVGGWALMTTLAEGREVHPTELVTV